MFSVDGSRVAWMKACRIGEQLRLCASDLFSSGGARVELNGTVRAPLMA